MTVRKTKVEPVSSGYSAHRERQRSRILNAAERLFDERGMDRVTTADITSASGIRASTLYQYFSNKDDIVWAIVSDLFAAVSAEAKLRMDCASDALAKITALLEFMADELERRPEKVRFMAQFDAMYARAWPTERLLTLEAQIEPQPFRFFSNLIQEGIADGSLRPDLDPDLTMHAVLNGVIGAQRRLASLGDKVESEYGHPIGRLLREAIRIILLGLRTGETATLSTKRAGPPVVRRKSSRKRSS